LTITGRDMNIVDSGRANIVDSRRATIVLHMGTQVTIKNTLLYPDSTHTLLNYRDIRKNGLYVITHEENNDEFLYIIKKNRDDHNILKKYIPYRLDCTIHT
jgi:hypothetical protein